MTLCHFWMFGSPGLLISYGRNSKPWVMHSTGKTSRKEREIGTVSDPESLSDWVQSHTAEVINIIFHPKSAPRDCQRWVSCSKITKHQMNPCQWPQSVWQPAFLQRKRCQLYSVCNPFLVSFTAGPGFNPSSLFNLSVCDVTQKEYKKTQPAFILVCFSSLDLSPSPLPEISSKSEYLQCFCSVNGFMLSSRHQKGSVLALILCLYWAGGGFKPSSIFGVYSKLSDLRAIYWSPSLTSTERPFWALNK